jgi:predicted ATPase
MTHLHSISFSPQRYPVRDAYPFNLETLRVTPSLQFPSPVTLLVGENGTGKSTVLRAIARACRIHIWTGMERARQGWNPHEDTLHQYVDVKWTRDVVPGAFFASENFRHFSELVDEWASTDPGLLEYFGGRSLLTQSHGQSHLAFFKSRFGIEGLYLLDEPDTALSPKSQLAFLQVIKEACATGLAQFIIATHSPILLSYPGATIYSFDHVPVRSVGYEETEHYKAYRGLFGQSPRGEE